MTPLPTTSRQTYRQLQIPPFAKRNESVTTPIFGFQPKREGELFASDEAPLGYTGGEPPVGYALELVSIYQPFYLAIGPEFGTEALNNAAEFTVNARMVLTRRGILIWEGSPSLTTLRAGTKEAAKLFYVVGQWGTQFQNPPIVQSPGELTLSATIVIAARCPEAAAVFYGFEFASQEYTAPDALWANQYVGPGSIGYGLVKL